VGDPRQFSLRRSQLFPLREAMKRAENHRRTSASDGTRMTPASSDASKNNGRR
jgi:hypothetical protein